MSMSSASSDFPATGQPGEDASQSVIDRFSKFDGTFHSSRDLRIDGQVEGTIDCQGNLFIAEGADVSAKVEADSISVAGKLQGDIHCRGRLHILPSGRLRGKITTETLVINEGAFYEGELEMTDPDKRLTAPKSPRSLTAIPSGRKEDPSRARRRGGHEMDQLPAPEPETETTSSETASNATFIRRFGGPETPWQGTERDQQQAEDTPPAKS
ncbi:MAG TPA: polymer-forming cytoskeletal protein [Thermomicrobiales bacterium]|nr:polymer-forming cytoskeletal protein [Thermomicrobiales bacterium]